MTTRETLERRLRRHQRALEVLEVERSNYGAAVPATLAEGILREEAAIENIETQLAALDADSQHSLRGDGRSDTDAEAQAIMDAQLSRMFQQMDRIDTRTEQTRDQMVEMRHDMQIMAQRVAHLEAQLAALQHGPQNVNRTWLLSGAVLLAAMFVLVVLLALRLV